MNEKQLSNAEVSVLCESAAMLLQAGIQTDEAVSLMAEDSVPGSLSDALKAMNEAIHSGGSFAAAAEKAGMFPAYALKMFAAGEKTGRLETVLQSLSKYYSRQDDMEARIKSAVRYPASMLILILAVLCVMVASVLPAFSRVYLTMAGSLAGSAYSYVNWAYGFCYAGLIIIAVLAVLLFTCLILWKTKRGRPAILRLLCKLPMTSKTAEKYALMRFTDAMTIFTFSGLDQDSAVEEASRMVNNASLSAVLDRCRKRMSRGESFPQAVNGENLYNPIYGRMLTAGARSGNLEQVLLRLTTKLESECGEQVDRLVSTAEPFLSGILMLAIGFSLISVMLPLIGIMASIG